MASLFLQALVRGRWDCALLPLHPLPLYLPQQAFCFCAPLGPGSWEAELRTETPPGAPLCITKNHRDNPGVAPFHSAKIKYVTGAFRWNEAFISMILRSATVHGFSYWAANILPNCYLSAFRL